jgi:LPXTG-motif cell wall-anchored protein
MLGRRRGRGRRAATGRPRAAARVAMALGAVLVVLAVVAPAAGANYARLEATAGCDRVVTWRATASVEGSAADRTNDRVAVEFRPTGTDGAWRAAGPEGSFTEGDDFSFTGAFDLPEGVDEVELRVTALVPWGPDRDGASPGAPRFATAAVPSACQGQPLAASQQLDCATGGVTVQARNVGTAALVAEVVVDRNVVRELEVPPGGEATLVVPVLAGRATPVEVRAGSFVASAQVHGADCTVEGPTAVVVERCGAPLGRLVVLATGADRAVNAQVVVRGTTVDEASIEPGTVLQRTLEVPATSLPVEVRLDGQVAAAGRTGGCDGPVAGLLGCGTAGRPACDLSATRPTTPPTPPAPPPPLQIDTGGAGLPRTGPAQRALGLLLGGVLLLGGGAALAARDRRRPAPSVLGAALEPYRQRWWDEL